MSQDRMYSVNKHFESLVFLKNFIERYERYKKTILFQRNSLTELISEIPSDTICNKSRVSFKITKPRSVIPLRVVRKIPNRQRERNEDNNDSLERLKSSLGVHQLKTFRLKNKQQKIRNSGMLCTDSSKRKQNEEVSFKACKEGKRKFKNKKRVSKKITSGEEGKAPPAKERIKVNLSKSLIELQDMDLDQVIMETNNLVNSANEIQTERTASPRRKSERSSIEALPVSKDEDVANYCDQTALSNILKASKYTKSERDILLGELIEFAKSEKSRTEIVDSEMKEDSSEHENIQQEGNGDSSLESKDMPSFGEKKSLSNEDVKRKTTSLSVKKISLATMDDEGEESPQPPFLTSFYPRKKNSLETFKMEGTLFRDMAKYYPAKIESLTNIKKYLGDRFTPEFKEVLEIVLRDFGLPENVPLLKELLSKSEETLATAQNFENIVKQKISRGEMYKSKDTEHLENLFQIHTDQDKDLLTILAPFLREKKKMQSETKENKKSPTSKTGKKGKHKKDKITPLDGPFNIMKRSDIRRNVWRAALKRAKKKIKFLNDTIEYRKKNGLGHDRYHQYFKEYFKRKRTEVKKLKKARALPALIKSRNLDLSEAETTTSFSSGDYYPEKALMKSIFYDYDELKDDFDVPPLKGRKAKVGKVDKLKLEKKRGRSGVTSSIWAPITEQQIITWSSKAKVSCAKRRARVIEDYIYSSADELVGYKNKQKLDKQKIMWELAESLIPDDIPQVQSEIRLPEEKQDIPKEKESFHEIKKKFKVVCMKYKMNHVYNLILRDRILKPPYDEQFMASVRKMGESLSPYDSDSSFHTSVIKKFLKMAVRTCLGMFYIMQKENSMFDEHCLTRGTEEGNISSSNVPLQWLLKNATIQEERNSKWLKRFFGLENSLKTEEKMSLYFGPPVETCVRFGPLKNKC